jgi:hypothetical protein
MASLSLRTSAVRDLSKKPETGSFSIRPSYQKSTQSARELPQIDQNLHQMVRITAPAPSMFVRLSHFGWDKNPEFLWVRR